MKMKAACSFLPVATCSVLVAGISGAQQQTGNPEETEIWGPVPLIVTPATATTPPSDALILFDGSDLTHWRHADGSTAGWQLEDGVMTVGVGSGDIETRQSFGDVQLHIEWRSPAKVAGAGQDRGNSGVFLQKRYEVQVLDSYENRTYVNGQTASLYKQYIPLVNASKTPGDWQTYDIVFDAPRFDEDASLLKPAYVTVLHNGVLVQNHVELAGPTLFIGEPAYEAHPAELPIMLQDHGSPVSFRNIWIRKLGSD